MKSSIFKNTRLTHALPFVLAFAGTSFATEGDLGGASYDGSEAKPYQISDAADLKAFAEKVNKGKEYGANAVLTGNISMNACGEGESVINDEGALNGDGTNFTQWTPIGTEQKPFNGTFDGKGFAISGLFFNNEVDYVGLFGHISNSGVVQNVGVVDSYFDGANNVGGVVGYCDGCEVTNVHISESVVKGTQEVGGVVGYCDYHSSVNNSYNAGTVSGSSHVGGVVGYNYNGSVSECYNAGSVIGGDGSDGVGGIVGYCDYHSSINNSYNTGVVSGGLSSYNIAGVAGYNINDGSIMACYNAGPVNGANFVGGVVGSNSGSVNNSYNAGSVRGVDNSNGVGGVAGFNSGSVINSYNTGAVSGTEYVGGIVVSSLQGSVINSYNTGAVSGTEYVGGVASELAGSIDNCFYNTDVTCTNCSIIEGIGKSAEEFRNGTVASLLLNWCEKDKVSDECKDGGLNGSIWGQNLSAENSLPDFSGVVIEKRGSVTFFNLIDGVADSAYVNATASDAVAFWDTVTVDGPIKFMRSFTFVNGTDAYSTIMLPFNPESLPEGVSFYAFNGVSTGEGEWTVDMTSVEKVSANTPYLVKVTSDVSSITFEGGEFVATNVPHVVNVENWNFVGTYEYKTWEEGDEGLGSTYGFAANDGVNDESIVGKFAKVGAGAYIYPMRAYLEYNDPATQSRPATNGVAAKTVAGNAKTVASLPDEIDVVIVEKDETTGEQTTRAIGKLDTRTGEFKFATDRWFDLQGRYLGNKKPAQKGAYYNNGKKVIVK